MKDLVKPGAGRAVFFFSFSFLLSKRSTYRLRACLPKASCRILVTISQIHGDSALQLIHDFLTALRFSSSSFVLSIILDHCVMVSRELHTSLLSRSCCPVPGITLADRSENLQIFMQDPIALALYVLVQDFLFLGFNQ